LGSPPQQARPQSWAHPPCNQGEPKSDEKKKKKKRRRRRRRRRKGMLVVRSVG
jgi:hypothetical protein